MSRYQRLFTQFRARLAGAVAQSPLLRVRIRKTGRLVDFNELARVAALSSPLSCLRCLHESRAAATYCARCGREIWRDRPRQALRSIIDERAGIGLTLRSGGSARHSRAEPESDETTSAQVLLFDALERRIRRHAELAARETGVHALWLGYPILHARGADAEQQVLAPLFLWPIAVEADIRRQGRFRIRREPLAGVARVNTPLLGWLKRVLGVELRGCEDGEVGELDWAAAVRQLERVCAVFAPALEFDPHSPLVAVPSGAALPTGSSPRLLNSAFLGYVHWPNEALAADLEQIALGEKMSDGLEAVLGDSRPIEADSEVPGESDRFLVRTADASQERVVWQSRVAPGLVVHGPPGTGKSQTIVNVMADALAHGRTVLMVCQKRVATQVVLERLRGVGLSELCVEVHDAEADRLAIFRSIRDQADNLERAEAPAVDAQRGVLAEKIELLEGELNALAQALHDVRPEVGESYRALLQREAAIVGRFPSVRVVEYLAGAVGGIRADELELLLPRVAEVGAFFHRAAPQTNPWRGHNPGLRDSPTLRSDVRALDQRLRALDARQGAFVKQRGAGIALPRDAAALDAWPAVQRALCPLRDEPESRASAMLRSLLRESDAADRTQTRAVQRRRQERAAAALSRVEQTALENGLTAGLDAREPAELAHLRKCGELVVRCGRRWSRFLSPAYYRARTAVRRVNFPAETPLRERAAAICRHLDARGARLELASAARGLAGGVEPPADETELIAYVSLAARQFATYGELVRLSAEQSWIECLLGAAAADDPAALAEALQAVERAVQRAPLAHAVTSTLEEARRLLTPEVLDEPTNAALAGESISPWLDRLREGVDGLEALLALERDRAGRSGAMRPVLEALEQYEDERQTRADFPAPPEGLDDQSYGRWWADLLDFNAVHVWQARLRDLFPCLLGFSPAAHGEKVAHLGELIERKRQLEPAFIRALWLARQLKRRRAPWRRMFQLRGSKHGSAKRLREAVAASLGEGLLDLRPCWLGNPASIAQAFPLDAGLFDLVIFDEASQCPLEQGLPAAFRGRVLVVSGDEKQLPPTSFFSPRAGGESDERDTGEDEEVSSRPVALQKREQASNEYLLGAEDFLQAAIGRLPERHLDVHYRSEHPALIEFSSRAFYGGRLEVPLPARTSREAPPLRFCRVEGCYAGRTNVREALRVIELLRGYWLGAAPCPTIGVVTFNLPQRDLIEDLIENECRTCGEFGARYEAECRRQTDNQDSGFFVKNLENVQGDERDVVIFSTTFGPDGDGRFHRRFGPVGALAGERRLNVAVTRARQQVVVVSSMPIRQISNALQGALMPTDLTPACFLQLYLAFAEACSDGSAQRANDILQLLDNGREPPGRPMREADPLLASVRSAIRKVGLEADTHVGHAAFGIALGVRRPEDDGDYMLGIELDGPRCTSERPARLAECWRRAILAQRGWRLHRIWSSRWWLHRDEELAALHAALEPR